MLKTEIDIREFRTKDYDELYRRFNWCVPKYFNIADAICDRPARIRGGSEAILFSDNGKVKYISYKNLLIKSNQFANLLMELGVKRGDRVAICTSQRVESIIALISIYKLGSIAVSISPQYKVDDIIYRVRHSGASSIVIEGSLLSIRRELSEQYNIENVIVVNGDDTKYENEIPFTQFKDCSSRFENVSTRSDDPAHIFYTSGTTGQPKGILHAHRFLLGLIPGYQVFFDLAPREGDVYWTPVDWGWLGSIGVIVLPTLYFGMPVVVYGKLGLFEPNKILDVLSEFKVTCAFLPPGILRLIKKSFPKQLSEYELSLRVIVSGGEVLSADLIKWVENELKCAITEIYGCSEAVFLTSMSKELGVYREGSLGKPIPGHIVDVIDENGNILPPGDVGYIAVKSPDPVIFLGYWGDPESTSKRYIDNWFLTGDLGFKDVDGYIWYKSRAEDLIQIEMLKIGPEELENIINQIPEVLESAVISYIDNELGNVIAVFIVLKSELMCDKELKDEIIKRVTMIIKDKIAIKNYSIIVRFINKLPKTITGKIRRYVLREKLRDEKIL